MRILVTGGAGFIGSNLCKFLLKEEKNEVICLDNFFTGSPRNIKDLIKNPKFSVFKKDITNPLEKDYFGKVDQIYNLACPASPIHYQLDPIETIKANTLGIVNLLDFAKLNNATILQSSTSEIY